jgi:cyclophilin family peptidyl-prolyl cis-trans isomerase/HEAT repeat protein
MKYLFLLLILGLVSCNSEPSSKNKFVDEILVRIADLKDRRLSDSLYQYFNNANPTYRMEAALSFGSIQDSIAVSKLEKLLSDTSPEVRTASAFAIGQTPSWNSAFYLMRRLPDEKVDAVRDEILEGIGKTIRADQLNSFLNSDFQPTRGLSWCLYRIGIRRMADSLTIVKATDLLDQKNNDRIRLGAAAFFFRTRLQDGLLPVETLCRSALNDPSSNVRMAAVGALRNATSEKALDAIRTVYENDKDYRVRSNAISALRNHKTAAAREMVVSALSDEEINVQITASEVIMSIAEDFNAHDLLTHARNHSYWRIKSNLYEAVLRISQDTSVVEEVKQNSLSSQDIYAQAAFVSALANSPLAAPFVFEKINTSEVMVVRSTAASTLVAMNRSKFFDTSMMPSFADMYKRALQISDLAVIGTISSALMDSTLGYKKLYKNHDFLLEARKKLSLPKDIEAMQTLQAAIDYFEGKKSVTEVENEFNHPIDWEMVKTISKDQLARIKTTKGEIVVHLLIETAPGSVANFVKLSKDHSFDLKAFHRVVPNFVIQGGCHRGDGWGGEDYSIRSEFSQMKYSEGSVGMASAGKDTEGTQWFITHSPTPHLDGRYTIFAEVVTGMNVVHEIQVGDLIESIELID